MIFNRPTVKSAIAPLAAVIELAAIWSAVTVSAMIAPPLMKVVDDPPEPTPSERFVKVTRPLKFCQVKTELITSLIAPPKVTSWKLTSTPQYLLFADVVPNPLGVNVVDQPDAETLAV